MPGPAASASALDEVARIVYFRPDTLPPGFQAEMVATRHYVPRAFAFAFTNGVQASHLEVDTDTGFIKLLKHWCIEDCGTVINPQLVDEQIRGGVVQGIGAALLEHCVYDDRGQLTNGTMADYLVPMAPGDARYRDRSRRDPDGGQRARRQGRGRSRNRRRVGRDHECRQRRTAPARRGADHGNSDYTGRCATGAGQDLTGALMMDILQWLVLAALLLFGIYLYFRPRSASDPRELTLKAIRDTLQLKSGDSDKDEKR